VRNLALNESEIMPSSTTNTLCKRLNAKETRIVRTVRLARKSFHRMPNQTMGVKTCLHGWLFKNATLCMVHSNKH